jgi:hypothetical protein
MSGQDKLRHQEREDRRREKLDEKIAHVILIFVFISKSTSSEETKSIAVVPESTRRFIFEVYKHSNSSETVSGRQFRRRLHPQ